MSLTIWCDKCCKRFPVAHYEHDVHLCEDCRGANAPLLFPLSQEEFNSVIDVSVVVREERTLTREDVKTDEQWRNLLLAAKGEWKGPDPFESFIDDMTMGGMADDVRCRIRKVKPRPIQNVQVMEGLL